MGSFNKLKSILSERENFLLICHVSPDGDAIGSLVGLGESLEKEGKRVTLVCKDPVPEVFQFIAEGNKIENEFDVNAYDAIVLLDNGDAKRTGFPEEVALALKKNMPVINIDHHQKNDLWKLASINYANPDASSTSEIIYELLIGLEYKITSKIATALLAGIFNDTGGFQHSNTSPKILEIASELLSHGAKLRQISHNISYTKPVEGLKLWGIALNRLKIIPEYKTAISVILNDDLVSVGAKEEDISGLTNFLNTIPGIEVSILLYETQDGKIKGSLRTENNSIDLSKLASLLGGGGLKKAAGFSFNGKIVAIGDEWRIE